MIDKLRVSLEDAPFRVGQKLIRADGHQLEVQAVEKHFGNVQVKYFDSFAAKTEWQEITLFRKELKGAKK